MAAMLISAQAVDYDGAVLSGAKLNVYDAGTSTPRAIYASKDLASGASSANPAVATATGGIAVWVDDSAGDIKVTLTNSAGTTTYYSQDNIDPTNGNLVVFPLGGSDQTTGTGDSVVFANLTVGAVAFSGVTADPGADRIMFWDNSDTQVEWLSLGTGLSITSNTLSLDGDLEDISGLTPADGAVIIGDGTDFTTESGATLRASLGVSIGSNVLAYDANLQAFVDAFTAPTTDGTAGQYLKTDGAGVLAFATPAGGGDTLAAANETISGDWEFTGSPDFSGVANAATIRSDLQVAKAFTVKNYGCAGDGVTNDSANFQAAATAAAGATLIVEEGTYAVKGINIPANTTVIFEGNAVLTPSDTADNATSSNRLVDVNSGVKIYGWRSTGVGMDSETGSYSYGSALYEATNSAGAPCVPVRHINIVAESTDVFIDGYNIENGGLGIWADRPNGLTLKNGVINNTISWPIALSLHYKNVTIDGLEVDTVWTSEAIKMGSSDGAYAVRSENITLTNFNLKNWAKSKDLASGKDGIDCFIDAIDGLVITDGVMDGPGAFELKPSGNRLGATELYFENVTIADVECRIIENDAGLISGGARLHWASSGAKRVQDQFRNVTLDNVNIRYVGSGTASETGFWIGLVDNCTMSNCVSSGFQDGIQLGEALPTQTTIDSTDVFTTDPIVSAAGDNSTDTFSLTYTLPAASMAVFLDNVLQTITTHYTFDLDAGTITFVTPPGSSVAIRVYQIDEVSNVAKTAGFRAVSNDVTADLFGIEIQSNSEIEGAEFEGGVYEGGRAGFYGSSTGVVDQCRFKSATFIGGADQSGINDVAVGGSSLTWTSNRFEECTLSGGNLYALYPQNSSDSGNECVECLFDLTGGAAADQAVRAGASNTGWALKGGWVRGNLDNATYGIVREDSGASVSVYGTKRTELNTNGASGPPFAGKKGEKVGTTQNGIYEWLCAEDGTGNWTAIGADPVFKSVVVRDNTDSSADITLRGSSINDSFAIKCNISGGYAWWDCGPNITTTYFDCDTLIFRDNDGTERARKETDGWNVTSGSYQMGGTPVIDAAKAPVLPSYTAAQIADAAHAVNTANKTQFKAVWDTTNNRAMVATGTGTTSPWYVADGSASVTPA
jgi:hypothetical protein